jgi:GGDEF domain-containing protein
MKTSSLAVSPGSWIFDLPGRAAAETALATTYYEERTVVAALFVVDGVWVANDRLGYPAGDSVLDQFSRTVNDALPPFTVLYRWSASSFLALLPNGAEPNTSAQALEAAATAASPPRLRAARQWVRPRLDARVETFPTAIFASLGSLIRELDFAVASGVEFEPA